MLEVKKLCKSYHSGKRSNEVLRNVTFSVRQGEFVSIMGKSGSGKTTLLNCISQFITYDSGTVSLDGKPLENLGEEEIAEMRNKKLGFVFQDFMLLDGLTVFDNICIPQIIGMEKYKNMESKAEELLKVFEIWHVAQSYPAEISGGERQRTAVARAMINHPSIILADEPTGNLDSRSGKAVIDSFLQAKKKLGATILMVTHDVYSASHCDRVIVMKDGNIIAELKKAESGSGFIDTLLAMQKKMDGGDGYE